MIDDVREILGALRDVRLDWMADEVELTIRTGKTVLKDPEPGVARQIKNATVTVSYSDEEELAICMRTLRAYFVDLPIIWDKTVGLLDSVFNQSRQHLVEITIADADNGPMEPFGQTYLQERQRLAALIERAGF